MGLMCFFRGEKGKSFGVESQFFMMEALLSQKENVTCQQI